VNARPTLLWFRHDLRLRDNPALQAALARGGPIIPVYIWDEAGEGNWAPGAASRWWLHHSLAALDADLRERGGRLLVTQGPAAAVLERLRERTGADALYWNRRYEPAVVARDGLIKREWTEAGLEARSFNATLLFEPHTVQNREGLPFRVFTPFWRHCQARPVEEPAGSAPARWPAPEQWPDSEPLEALALRPTRNWADGFSAVWTPGENGARAQLRRFLREGVADYDQARDRPAEAGTSRLSPHLHFGEIGPRQVWAGVKALSRDSGVFPSSNGARIFLTELGWREFAHHQLFHFPHTPEQPLRDDFRAFPWRADPNGQFRQAWERARTGYPIVDAGLRQLWATGWMHNRVRMIVASFLVKHLRLPWTVGAAWFWETLVDADLANNTLGWQWSAGCGADAAPYFRIFNPMTQGAKFDPDAAYVQQWVPELRRLPAAAVHAPWEASPAVLAAAGVELGRTYPRPIVNHGEARAEALAAFAALRQSRGARA
jgi:deoxyribodipyrimidine photo-lyase